jgi:hypothetical protein
LKPLPSAANCVRILQYSVCTTGAPLVSCCRARPRRLRQLATQLWRAAPPGLQAASPRTCWQARLAQAALPQSPWRRLLRVTGEGWHLQRPCRLHRSCAAPGPQGPYPAQPRAGGAAACSVRAHATPGCSWAGIAQSAASGSERTGRGCRVAASPAPVAPTLPVQLVQGPTAAAAEAARWQERRGLPAARIRASTGTGTSKASRQVCASQQGSPQAQSTSSSRALTGPAQAPPLPGPRCALLLGPPRDDGALLVL